MLTHMLADEEEGGLYVVLGECIQKRGCIARAWTVIVCERDSVCAVSVVWPCDQRLAADLRRGTGRRIGVTTRDQAKGSSSGTGIQQPTHRLSVPSRCA